MKGKVYISGKLYFKLFKERKLRSLAYYILWSAKYSHKRFNILKEAQESKHTISEKTIYKHLKILSSYGLCTYDNYNVTLTSNSVIRAKYNDTKEKLYFTTSHDIKNLYSKLKAIPIVSNLHNQLKGMERKEKYRTILQKSKRKNGNVKLSDYKRLKKYLAKKGWTMAMAKEKLKVQKDCNISVDKICSLLGTSSRNTAIKYRRDMCKKFHITAFKRWFYMESINKYSDFVFHKSYNPQYLWDEKKQCVKMELARGFRLDYVKEKQTASLRSFNTFTSTVNNPNHVGVISGNKNTSTLTNYPTTFTDNKLKRLSLQ